MESTILNKWARTRRRNRFKQNGIASVGALIMGGIAPAVSFCVSHFQAPDLTQSRIDGHAFLWLITAGLLVYSGPLIISWFSRYVGSCKALGFVLAMEVTQTFTALNTAIPALLVLVVLNAIILRERFLQD